MQSLDVISINLWQMAVSLINLLILFLLIKKFLYKPVKKMLRDRQNTIDGKLEDAEKEKQQAIAQRLAYEEKLSSAKDEADGVIQSAVTAARQRENEIIEQAEREADIIVARAKEDAELEKRKAQETIKQEIVEVSSALAEKLVGREINASDHDRMIEDFLENIGDSDE